MPDHKISFTYLSQEDLLNSDCFDISMAMEVAEKTMLAFENRRILFPEKIVQIFDQFTQDRINCLPATLLRAGGGSGSSRRRCLRERQRPLVGGVARRREGRDADRRTTLDARFRAVQGRDRDHDGSDRAARHRRRRDRPRSHDDAGVLVGHRHVEFPPRHHTHSLEPCHDQWRIVRGFGCQPCCRIVHAGQRK